jgi:DNA-binding protein H-NS
MANFKFEALTTSELLDIRDYVGELLKSRVANERREIEEALARIGEGGAERARPGRRRSSLKGVKVAPKYRNPQTGETWAGRGATPRWLQALLRRGRKLEDFAIDKHVGRKSRAAKRPRKNRAAKRARHKKR